MSENNEFDLDVTEDPEVLENDDNTGDEASYDGKAVETIPFDPAQFELSEDGDVDE